MAAEKTTMKVNIVAADHPVWHGDAASVTIPASEGGMGILPDHGGRAWPRRPVLRHC
jgi:F-type H+-transporting ATPase subunit epsilon